MIHIVFQRNDVDLMKQVLLLDPTLEGEIIQIADDFAVGPLEDLSTGEGRERRKQWWRQVLEGGDYEGLVDDGSVRDDQQTVQLIRERLLQDPELQIWIWAAQNKHDVSGYYWLVSQLKDFQGRIFILYLNNLPFINSKGHIFYPVNLSEIPAPEFLKAKKLARPVTTSEFEVDSDEWMKLNAEGKGVRLLEGGKKLIQAEYDYYDSELRKFINQDWQRASKVIHQFLSKSREVTGDAYLLWRLKLLARAGEVEVQGELKKMKEFELKIPASEPANHPVST
jgi:hypothetical protein